jgi:transposase
MDTHPDGEIFRSFPRAGTINAGQILAEWGDAREVFNHPDAIAALAGITPVTKASGKHESPRPSRPPGMASQPSRQPDSWR